MVKGGWELAMEIRFHDDVKIVTEILLGFYIYLSSCFESIDILRGKTFLRLLVTCSK